MRYDAGSVKGYLNVHILFHDEQARVVDPERHTHDPRGLIKWARKTVQEGVPVLHAGE
jgi:hypothetical protein